MEGDSADEAFAEALRRNNDDFEANYSRVEEALDSTRKVATGLLEREEGGLYCGEVATGVFGREDDGDEKDEVVTDLGFKQCKINDVFEITKWLSLKISIEITSPQSFLEAPYRVEEFRDGLKLVNIAERLLTKKIKGVSRQPKTKAARVGNIKRAIDALLNAEELGAGGKGGELKARARESHAEIEKGNGRAVMEVLGGVKKLYDFRRV